MSSLSTRATRLATGATCRPVKHGSASLGASRSAPLKPRIQQLATIVMATSPPPSRRCTSTASRRRSLPGQEIDPWAQVRDFGRAIAYTRTRPEVGVDRIGVRGSSYSGGDVLELRGSTIALSASPPRHRWSTAPATPSAVRQDFLAPKPRSHAARPRHPLPRRAAGDGALGRPRPYGRLGPAHPRDWFLEHLGPAR